MRAAFSTLALVLSLGIAGARAEHPLEERSEQYFSLPLDGAITIQNGDGAIHIFGWYEPRVRLVTLRRAYTAKRLKQIRVETAQQPRALTARTIIPRVSGLFADRSGTVDYTVNVPETARLKLQLTNGEITLQGLRGAKVDLELVNGRVIALNSYAEVRASLRNGVAEAFFEWWENLPATFDYALQRGRIGARLPAAAQFQVKALTASGRIHQGFNFSQPAAAGAGQRLEAATGPETAVRFHLETGGGNISLDAIR